MHLLSTFGVSNGQEIRYIVNSLTEYRLDSVTLPQSVGIYPELSRKCCGDNLNFFLKSFEK